jgi:O-antigen ligase
MQYFAVIALVSSAWSPTTISTVRALQYVIAVELIAEVVYVCRGHARLAERFWFVFSVATTVTIGVAVLATLAPGSGFTPWFPTFQGVDRFRLLAMHPIATAGVLGLGLLTVSEPLLRPAILGRRSGPGAPSWRVGRLALAAAMGAMLLLTRERTSTVACVVAVGCLAMCLRNRGRVQARVVGGLAVGIVAVLLFAEPLVSLFLRGQSTSDLAGLSGRNEIITMTSALFRQHPLTGQGYLTGRSVFLPTIPWAGESHNAVVEIVISFGIVGLLLFVAVFSRWFQLARRGRRSLADDRRVFAVRSIALVVLVLVVGIAADSFAGPPGLAVLVFLLGLAFAELAAGPDDLPEVG